jgi:hypothetical protein
MTTYRLFTPHFVAAIIEDGGLILQSAPSLAWSVGRQFSTLRDYAEAKGWTIQPLINEVDQTNTIKYQGTTYEFYWEDGRIVRITRHTDDASKDITISELPKAVRNLL